MNRWHLKTTVCFSTCDTFDQPVRSTKFHQLLVIYDSFCSWKVTNLIHNCNFDDNPKDYVLTASASQMSKFRNSDIFPKHWPKKLIFHWVLVSFGEFMTFLCVHHFKALKNSPYWWLSNAWFEKKSEFSCLRLAKSG